jgi:hypothetical protein
MAMTPKRRFEALKRDGFACHYCGRKPPDVELHIDHVIPLAGGGTDKQDNLVAACFECNIGKSATPLESVSEAGSETPIGPGDVTDFMHRAKRTFQFEKPAFLAMRVIAERMARFGCTNKDIEEALQCGGDAYDCLDVMYAKVEEHRESG